MFLSPSHNQCFFALYFHWIFSCSSTSLSFFYNYFISVEVASLSLSCSDFMFFMIIYFFPSWEHFLSLLHFCSSLLQHLSRKIMVTCGFAAFPWFHSFSTDILQSLSMFQKFSYQKICGDLLVRKSIWFHWTMRGQWSEFPATSVAYFYCKYTRSM